MKILEEIKNQKPVEFKPFNLDESFKEIKEHFKKLAKEKSMPPAEPVYLLIPTRVIHEGYAVFTAMCGGFYINTEEGIKEIDSKLILKE